MEKYPIVANDVYRRYGLRWAEFPNLATPSEHSDEIELFCAKQSLAVYGSYPSTPYVPRNDHIPSIQKEAIIAGNFDIRRIFGEDTDDPTGSFESEQGYQIVTSDRASALLVWNMKHLIIAFRGTANWQDWIHNFTGGSISTDFINGHGEIMLHKGFTGLAENIAPAVIELILKFLETKSRHGSPPILTFCGHSLGGALALNFASKFENLLMHNYAYRILRSDWPAVHLGATYTFGAPRIGKGRVWDFIHRPHYRLVVRGDPVPSFPLECSSDFQATYLEKAKLPPTQPKTQAGKIAKAVWTMLPIARRIDLSVHNIEAYIHAIEAKIAAKEIPQAPSIKDISPP